MITKEQALEALESLAWPLQTEHGTKQAEIVRAYIEQAEPSAAVTSDTLQLRFGETGHNRIEAQAKRLAAAPKEPTK